MKRKHSILAGLLLLTISSFGQDYIELAKQAWANKKYYDVIDYANKSLNVSSSGSAYWYRGIARYELQNYSEALPDFKSAIVYYSDYSSLGKLYYWAAYCKYVLKDYKGAISDFESSKNYGYEDKTNLYWYLGSANRNIAEYQKAAEAYTTAIGYTVDNSTLSNLYQLRGDARYELFKNNDAISDYIKAIEYNSNNSNAFWARAIARAANFQYDLAIGDFTSAINIIERENKAGRENDLSILYSNRGLYQYYLVKYDEAKADLQKSLDLNPNYDKANRNMGDVLYALKKYKEANPYYLRAVSLVKDDADRASCYSSLYWSCRYMLDYTQALTYLNSAIKINPNIHNYYRNRAYLQAVKKNYSASLDDYNKAIELYSKDTSSLISLYSDRAQLKIKMKNNTGALADFQRAVALDPAYSDSYYELGRFFKQVLKQNDLASVNLQKAADLLIGKDTTSSYAYAKVIKGDKQEAFGVIARLIKKEMENKERLKWEYHNAACIYALAGDAAKAFQYLDKSFVAGYDDYDHLINDRELESLMKLPQWKALLTKYKVPQLK